MNNFRYLVNVALIHQQDNFGSNLFKQVFHIFIVCEQELKREHFMNGNGDIVLRMVGLKPTIDIQVLLGDANVWINALCFLHKSESCVGLNLLVAVNALKYLN